MERAITFVHSAMHVHSTNGYKAYSQSKERECLCHRVLLTLTFVFGPLAHYSDAGLWSTDPFSMDAALFFEV